jgi:hypothetical protein
MPHAPNVSDTAAILIKAISLCIMIISRFGGTSCSQPPAGAGSRPCDQRVATSIPGLFFPAIQALALTTRPKPMPCKKAR